MTEPGWYNDEQDAGLARWHDGTGWTGHTMVKADWPGPGTPPPPAALPAPSAPAGPPLGAPLGRPPEPTRDDTWLATAPTPVVPEPAPGPPPPPEPDGPGRAPRPRPSGHLIGAIGALVVAAVCLIALQRLHDEPATDASAPTTSSTLPSQRWRWTADAAGTAYEITVTADPTPIDQPSPHGCVAGPKAGTTNLAFTVTIENPSITQTVDVPPVSFGLDVGADGKVDPGITSFEHASTAVEISPIAGGTSCSEARSIQDGGGEPLPPGGSTTFTGVVGGAPKTSTEGLALVVRVFQHDPNPRANPRVPLDTVVRFPVRGAEAS
jgi:hypothetical protein